MPQRAVDRERIHADVGRETLRQHDLVDVARRDVLLRLPDDRFERRLREVRRQRQRLGGLGPRQRQRAFELAFEEIDLRARELVEAAQFFVAGDARVGDQQDAVLHVIERQHRVEQHEAGVVAAPRVRPGRATVGSNQLAVS